MNKENRESWIQTMNLIIGLIIFILGLFFAINEIPNYLGENIGLFFVYLFIWLLSVIIASFFIAISLGITNWKEIKKDMEK